MECLSIIVYSHLDPLMCSGPFLRRFIKENYKKDDLPPMLVKDLRKVKIRTAWQ